MTAGATGEYATRGDYHRSPSPDWDYYPTYMAKLAWVRQYLDRLPPGTRVLDAGCGEGVLVESYAGRLRIAGVDDNYSSAHVIRGSLMALPYGAATLRPGPLPRRPRAPVLRRSATRARGAPPRAHAGWRAARLGPEPRAPAVATELPAARAA